MQTTPTFYRYTVVAPRPAHSARPTMPLCPAWAVRALRTLLLLTFLLSFVLLLVLLSNESLYSESSNKHFTLGLTRQYAEKSGLCDRVDESPDPLSFNETVRRLCRDLRQDERRFYRRRHWKVNAFQHKFLLKGKGVCQPDTNIVVLIHSLHTYEERRRGIRDTWGKAVQSKSWPGHDKVIKDSVSVAFVLGYHRNDSWNIKVYKEAQRHKDIIMGDFIDDYKNMTLKSLLGLKWVLEYCPKVKVLIKSDDDMIINFPHLLDIIRGADMTRAIMGPINVGSRVLRVGKWMIPKQDFPFYYYPPYESGACYVISGDIIKEIYEAAEYIPWIFIDDVYITGIVGKIIGARHVVRPGFAYWSSAKPKACDLVQNKIITGTKMISQYLRKVWTELHENPICSVPTTP